jgi:hypothetical protein
MSSFIAIGSSSIASDVISKETSMRCTLDLRTPKRGHSTHNESDARTHRTRKALGANVMGIPFRASSPRDESVRWRTLGVRTRPLVALERLAEELSARGINPGPTPWRLKS